MFNPWTTHHPYTCLTIRRLLPNTSAHIVKWIRMSTLKDLLMCTQVKKRNTIAWCDPGEKASHIFVFLFKNKVLVMACNVLNQIFCANVSQPTMIPIKKINYKALKWTIIFDQICWHETNFSVIKSAQSFRNDLEKIQIDVPQKINDFTLQF